MAVVLVLRGCFRLETVLSLSADSVKSPDISAFFLFLIVLSWLSAGEYASRWRLERKTIVTGRYTHRVASSFCGAA